MNTDSTTNDLTIREATEHDARSIAKIYNLHVHAGGVTFDIDRWSDEEAARRISRGEPDGWYLAENRTGVIGWASLRRYSGRYGYRFTCESAIYLDPTAYGKGVGDRLQARVEAHCRRCGIHHAVAKIVSGNQRSIAFHLKHGYRIVGVQHEVGRIDDRWVDVTILERIFSE